MKTAVMVLGFAAIAVALADLATGNTSHNPLPAFISDHLDQQEDLALGAVGAAALWLAFTQL